MLPGLHLQIGKLIKLRLVKKPQKIPGGKETGCRFCDLLLGNQAVLTGLLHIKIGAAAVQITAVIDCQSRRFLSSGCHHMAGMKITDGPAIRNKVPLKAPLTPKDALKLVAAAAGLPIHPVVGSHDGLHPCVLHQHLKGRKVGLVKIFFCRPSVKLMAQSLRSGVNREMLRAGGGLHIFTVSLKTFYKSGSQFSGEVRVLSVGLMTPAPSGITENVDIRRPEGQSLINIPVIVLHILIVFRSSLSGNNLRHLMKKLRIKAGCQTDRLRKNRRLTASGHAMKSLIPPVVRRNPQVSDGRRVVT